MTREGCWRGVERKRLSIEIGVDKPRPRGRVGEKNGGELGRVSLESAIKFLDGFNIQRERGPRSRESCQRFRQCNRDHRKNIGEPARAWCPVKERASKSWIEILKTQGVLDWGVSALGSGLSIFCCVAEGAESCHPSQWVAIKCLFTFYLLTCHKLRFVSYTRY